MAADQCRNGSADSAETVSATDIDTLLARLDSFGAYTMNDDGELSAFQPNQLTSMAAATIRSLVAIIDRHTSTIGDDGHIPTA